MSTNISELQRFQQDVLADPNLQRLLRETTGKERFMEQLRELAEERGYRFTEVEVENAMRAAMRTWLERWID
jgi:spore germination protein YaaH